MPRIFHTRALIPARYADLGKQLNEWPIRSGIRLVADKEDYTKICRLQGMRACAGVIAFLPLRFRESSLMYIVTDLLI